MRMSLMGWPPPPVFPGMIAAAGAKCKVAGRNFKPVAGRRRCRFRITPSRDAFVMATATDVEELTRAYGREIFARLDPGGPVPFGPGWWDERLMDWTMGDPAVKVQLFRFI